MLKSKHRNLVDYGTEVKNMKSKKYILISAVTGLILLSGCQSGTAGNSGIVVADGSKYITERQAQLEALTNSGVAEADASGMTVKLDKDDGRVVYDVEFWSGNTEYDYEIDAVSGDIIKSEKETKPAVTTAPSSSGSSNSGSTQTQYIGENSAKQKAFSHAGVSSSNASNVVVKLDKDNGKVHYDVEFRSGNTEYDYEIDAVSGDIIKSEKETKPAVTTAPSSSGSSNSGSTQTQYIGENSAKQKAFSHAGVSSSNVSNVVVKLDRDDGRTVYDVEFRSGNTEYDYEIDAVSGDIIKSEKETKPAVTTAPSNGGTSNSGSTQTQYIGETSAKQKAFSHAGVSSSNASNVVVKLDKDDGKVVYDVEFRSGNTEYDYEIDAVSGNVLKYDKEVKASAGGNSAGNNNSTQTQYIGENSAKQKAFSHAGVSSSNVSNVVVKLDRDDGRTVYDVEFRSGNTEYDYEIDAVSGNVLKYDKEVKASAGGNSAGNNNSTQTQYIGENSAKQKAFSHAGVSSSNVSNVVVKLDRDDGRTIYEIEFRSGIYEYDYEIDATNGNILKSEKDIDD